MNELSKIQTVRDVRDSVRDQTGVTIGLRAAVDAVDAGWAILKEAVDHGFVPQCTGHLNRRTGKVEHLGHCPVCENEQ